MRVLTIDIETAGVNAHKADLGFVIVFGYKWLDERYPHSIEIDKHGLDTFNDKKLLKAAANILSQADAVIGHYAGMFDKRFLQGRFVLHNIVCPLPVVRDTCSAARRVATFSSNRLGHLSRVLDLRHKKQESGWPTAWFQVMRGNTKTLTKLAKYCRGDVVATEDLYLRLRPFVKAWKK